MTIDNPKPECRECIHYRSLSSARGYCEYHERLVSSGGWCSIYEKRTIPIQVPYEVFVICNRGQVGAHKIVDSRIYYDEQKAQLACNELNSLNLILHRYGKVSVYKALITIDPQELSLVLPSTKDDPND